MIRLPAGRLPSLRLAFRIIWNAAAPQTIIWALLLTLQGLLPAAIVYLTKWLVDAIAAALGSGVSWEAALPVLLPAGIMALLMLTQRILGAILEVVRTAQSELVQDHVKGMIHGKASSVDYAFFESSEYYDKLEQANGQASGRILSLLNNVGGLFEGVVTLLAVSALLMTYSIFLPLVLILSTLPALLVLLRHNRLYHAWWMQATPRRRLAEYYDVMLTLQAAAAEIRINNLGASFIETYRALRTDLRNERISLMRRQIVARLGAAVLGLIVTGGTMLWIGMRALGGTATLGDLALFYGAFNQAQSLMGRVLQNAGQIVANMLFLENLADFLNQKNAVEESPRARMFPTEFSSGIRFENVTFCYPGREIPALKDFDLFIPAGRIVAVVGENGAGKSTLIKLLCRFYDPQQGRITVDGIDLREFAQSELRARLSIMFQTPMRYQMTARRNIELGDLEAADPHRDVREAAIAAGADEFISRLPQGYDTLLGRWFATGSELSGGEWQRVALARAFLRKAPLVILDEPTSAMDSWAENEWLKRYRRLVAGRTSLIITHRFTTAMQADVIHVLHEGRLIESGTHAHLVSLGGVYATSWHTQIRAEERGGRPEAPVAITGVGT
jgi:ATP-binding cassette, subfamily B, bacterial